MIVKSVPSDGDTAIDYSDSVGLERTIYYYQEAHERLMVTNKGNADIVLMMDRETYTIAPNQTKNVINAFTSFSIVSTSGVQTFRAVATDSILASNATSEEFEILGAGSTLFKVRKPVVYLPDEISFNHRNILKDTAFTHVGKGAWNGFPTIKTDDSEPYVEMNYGWGFNQIVPFLKTGTYTMKVMAKEDNSPDTYVKVTWTGAPTMQQRVKGLGWYEYTFTFTLVADTTNLQIYFQNGVSTAGNQFIKWKKPKLFLGVNPNDTYTQAPEDIGIPLSNDIQSKDQLLEVSRSVIYSNKGELIDIHTFNRLEERVAYLEKVLLATLG